MIKNYFTCFIFFAVLLTCVISIQYNSSMTILLICLCCQVVHNLQYEAVWRNLSCLNKASSFAVREQAGHERLGAESL